MSYSSTVSQLILFLFTTSVQNYMNLERGFHPHYYPVLVCSNKAVIELPWLLQIYLLLNILIDRFIFWSEFIFILFCNLSTVLGTQSTKHETKTYYLTKTDHKKRLKAPGKKNRQEIRLFYDFVTEQTTCDLIHTDESST